MFKKNFLIIALQAVIIGVFILIAAGSGEGLSSDQAYDAGYKIGEGVGTLLNN